MRIARVVVPSVAYHVIWRFVDRSWFFSGDDERARYLRYLGRALATSDWLCFAFALMSNHIHLALVAGREDLEKWAKRVSSPFARWMNKRHGRLGPVMADRPKSVAICKVPEAEVVAYIHNNPVRAGVVATASQSTWTSHRFYLNETPPGWLRVDVGLDRMGIAVERFDDFVNRTPGTSGHIDLRRISKAARTRGGVELATPTADGRVPLVCRPFAHLRPSPALIVRFAADAAGVPLSTLVSRQRSSALLKARVAAIHCAYQLGVTGADIAAALGLSPSRICAVLKEPPDKDASAVLALTMERLALELDTP